MTESRLERISHHFSLGVAMRTLATLNLTMDLASGLTSAGADALVVGGTTGGGHLMTCERLVRLIGFVGRWLANEVVLIAGIGSDETDRAERVIAAAAESGYCGILSLTHRDPVQRLSQMRSVAELCSRADPNDPLGLWFYQINLIEGLGAVFIVDPGELDTVRAEYSHVLGAKNSLGKVGTVGAWLRANTQPTPPIECIGSDFLIAPSTRILRGLWAEHPFAIISGCGNSKWVMPHLCSLRSAAEVGDLEEMGLVQTELDKQVRRIVGHRGGYIAALDEELAY